MAPNHNTYAILIQPHPSSPFDKALLLTPRLVLCRAFLPLSYLDPVTSSSSFPVTRLFSIASLPLLETPLHEARGSREPIVLIAELEEHGSLYAVERVQRGIYALCKLVDWLKVEDLGESALKSLGCSSRPALRRRQNSSSKSEWWSNAALEVHGAEPDTQLQVPKARPARNVQLCMQRAPIEHPTTEIEPRDKDLPNHERPEDPVQDCIVGDTLQPADCGALLPEELYEMIRVQYQETLYISKVTTLLAWFGKTLTAAGITGILCKRSFITSPRCFLKPSRPITDRFRPCRVLANHDIVAFKSGYQVSGGFAESRARFACW